MGRVPDIGDKFNGTDFEMILDAIQKRKANFPDEPAVVGMGFILMNVGDAYSEVKCVEGEWSGRKADVEIMSDGSPKCPAGHAVVQEKTVRLGWVATD